MLRLGARGRGRRDFVGNGRDFIFVSARLLIAGGDCAVHSDDYFVLSFRSVNKVH